MDKPLLNRSSLIQTSLKLPTERDQSIVKMNRDIQRWRVLERGEGGVFDAEEVFPHAAEGENHRLVHYIILMGWYDSPLRHHRNFSRLRKEALSLAFIDADTLPQFSERLGVIGLDDVNLVPGEGLGWKYFDRFMRVQGELALLELRSHQSLRWKLSEYYHRLNIEEKDEHENLGKILSEFRSFLTASQGWVREDVELQNLVFSREVLGQELYESISNHRDYAEAEGAARDTNDVGSSKIAQDDF